MSDSIDQVTFTRGMVGRVRGLADELRGLDGVTVETGVDPAAGESYTRAYTPDAPGTETARRLLTGGDPDAKASLPPERRFRDKGGYRVDFCRAPEVEEIAERLIWHYPEFVHLRGLRIAYLWRRKKQAKGGKLVLGTCSSLSGIPQAFLEADWAVTIGAESCRETKLTAYQLEALVYHELSHIAPPDEDDPESVPTLCGHDAELFLSEIRRYGLWEASLKQTRDTFADLPLFAGMVG